MRYRSRQTGRFVPTDWARRHPDKVVEAPSKGRAKSGFEKMAERGPVEYEITATTRGGTPRRHPGRGGRRVDQRVLQLKIRIVAPEGTLQEPEDAMRMLSKARRGVPLPEGVSILWIDWQKGTGRTMNSGQVPGREARDGLESFWKAMSSGHAHIDMGGVR